MRGNFNRGKVMDWREVLLKLKSVVPAGTVTTYKELSLWAFDKPTGTQAIVAMLKAAVNANIENAIFTNRVIPETGKLADPNGQISQLEQEDVPIKNGTVNLKTAKVIRFAK